ncbi:CDP-glycerol glycerophosphotransferase family protein [Butyrivibrio sp. AE2032]|uniref:CDP-glycerol glycerophosphotransferase family protein n=1 Tax=Butyrivibrio sp. AE2032 TaxID=1458463 RepID=UPI00068E9048|nr:CDP-glycerol glycerophosphotransferase family protein [Butyrivibrio sp. AE2032]
MRIILFGMGKYLANRQKDIRGEDEIVAYMDNRASEIGSILGKPVIAPEDISNYSYDAVLTMSVDSFWMRKQLLVLGVPAEKIWSFEKYQKYSQKHSIRVANEIEHKNSKSVLVVTDGLFHNGGAIAAFTTCKALIEHGFETWVCAAFIDGKMLEEFKQAKIGVVIDKALPYITEEECFWMRRFDVVIVNTFPMVKCAVEIGKFCPVIFWVHEMSRDVAIFYERTLNRFEEYRDPMLMMNSKCQVFAVSNMARKAFEEYYPGRVDGILTIGMLDGADGEILVHKDAREKVVFAQVGVWEPWKAQHLLIEAVEQIPQSKLDKSHFMFIGSSLKKEYGEKLIESIKEVNHFSVYGPMDREEIFGAYKNVDVIVCASIEETVSLAIVEGMMLGKVCIASDNTGVAEYMEDGINGFLFESGNVEALRNKIEYVIDHFEEMGSVRAKARETYEKVYSYQIFANNLVKSVTECYEGYRSRIDYDFRSFLIQLPIAENKIMFDCFEGGGFGDNGKYLALELLKKAPDLDLVWNVKNEFEAFPTGIRKVIRFSKEYYEELYSARVLVCNDGTFEDDLVKKEGQFIIDTWHGTGPFKKVFASIESKKNNKSHLAWVKDTFGRADAFVSNSMDNTDMYQNSMLFDGEIWEIGYPRNDILFGNQRKANGVKAKLSIDVDMKVVLYVPTFRDGKKYAGLSLNEMKDIMDALSERFGGQFVFLVRNHHSMARPELQNSEHETIMDVTNYPDVMELLLIADAIISDYSSIIWDASLMKKPVFLYQPDLEEYCSTRDFYLSVEKWPYPSAGSLKQMIKNIKDFEGDLYKKKLESFFEDYPSYDDGHASEKLADKILDVIRHS